MKSDDLSFISDMNDKSDDSLDSKRELSNLESFPGTSPPGSAGGEADDDDDDDTPKGQVYQHRTDGDDSTAMGAMEDSPYLTKGRKRRFPRYGQSEHSAQFSPRQVHM